MTELKPCPFCDADNSARGDIIQVAGTNYWKHWHNGCILSGFVIKDIDEWNRRANNE